LYRGDSQFVYGPFSLQQLCIHSIPSLAYS